MKFSSKLLLAAGLLSVSTLGANAAGWPANYEGVMLQGFSWDNYTDTKWTALEANSDELSTYFDLIWVPNSGYCGGHNNMGYMPIYWFSNHNSSFGTEAELRKMIATFKAKGTGIIEDVVINHRNGVSNWSDFPTETWNGQTWHIGLDGICNNDEMNWAAGQPKPTGAADTGENFDGARDLDHTNANVQNNCKNYCKFLLQDLGYVGFRYDMVKGYSGYYTGIYNEYSQPAFSVGEYWDGQYDAVAAWIEATGKRSAAFDFPGKYCINEAFHSNDMTKLVWKANGTTDQPAGLIHYGYTQYAVTFVDNHDTYRDGSKFNGNVMAANAFILCSPGTPCVFLEHYKANKAGIQALIKARKAAGIHNNSPVTVLRSSNDCYMAEVTGSKGKLVVKVGSAMASPSGYSNSDIVASGTDYCVWVKTGGSSSLAAPASLYVMGNLAAGSWQTNGGVKMTKSGNTFSAKNVKLVAATNESSCYFNFAAAQGANWNVVNASNRYGASYEKEAAIIGSNSFTLYEANVSASGCASWSIAPGTYNFTLNFDTRTLTISQGEDNGEEEEGDDDDPIVNPGDVVTIYFDNTASGWSTPYIYYWDTDKPAWPGVAMEKVGGQTWKYDCPLGITGCLFNAGDGDTTKTADFTAIHNHVYTTSGDQGVYDPETPVGMPAKLYIIGNLNVGSWSTSNAIEMTKEGASFVARNVTFTATEADSPVYFSFITVTGADWNVVNASNRYGATTKDEELPIGESADIKLFSGSSASSAYAWQLPEAGTYDVIADFLNMQVSVIQSLGAVNSIETEVSAEAPVFYNLQGLRIDNPGRGLFIMVKDGKASKVIR